MALNQNSKFSLRASDTVTPVSSGAGGAQELNLASVPVADFVATAEDILVDTDNQITITITDETITFSTPQNTHTAATPQFSRIGLGAAADANAAINAIREDSGTNNVVNVVIVSRNSTGTPAAGFGNAIELQLETNTTPNTRAGAIEVQHIVATHASRTARLRIIVADASGDREAMRFDSDGSAIRIGAYGVPAVARPSALTQTYSTATTTHANPTASTLTDSSGGTANTTVQALPDPADAPLLADDLRDDLVLNLIPALRNNFADLAAQINALIADHANTKQFLNQAVDQLQSEGWLQ